MRSSSSAWSAVAWLTFIWYSANVCTVTAPGSACAPLSASVIRCFTSSYGNGFSNSSAASSLLSRCFVDMGSAPPVLHVLVIEGPRIVFEQVKAAFTAQFGLAVQFTYTRAELTVASQLKAMASTNTSQAVDLFLYSSSRLADYTSLGLLTDLTPFISADPTGMGQIWTQLHTFYRQDSAVFGGRLVGIPVFVLVPCMFWRMDVFQALNLTVPDTWDEALAVAQVLANTDWDPAVPNKMGVCFNKPLGAVRGTGAAYVLSNIFGSMVQYRGRSQGVLFDPDTMDPLVDSPPMSRALDLYRQLAVLMPDMEELVPPEGVVMASGRCAFGFRFTDALKASALSPALKGRLGSGMLPGSSQVWDRTSRQWLDCTPTLCLGSDPITRPDSANPARSVTRYVNRMLLGGSAYGMAVNARTSPARQQSSYLLDAFLGSAVIPAPHIVINPWSFAIPMTPNLLAASSLSTWLAWGYNEGDVLRWLAAVRALLEHPNAMLDFRLPDQYSVQLALDDAANAAEASQAADVPAIMAQAAQRLAAITSNWTPGGRTAYQALYWLGIGYSPPAPPPPPPDTEVASPRDGGVKLSPGAVAGLTVGCAVGVAAAVVFMLIQRHAAQRRVAMSLGPTSGPGLGPNTTLLVTDVQGSTQLWDDLPATVMEEAIAVHFITLRAVATAHLGYESSTEGDSIILGFHSPLKALQAALAAQEALLAANWPAWLLAHPLCAPQWAVSSAGTYDQPHLPVWGGHSGRSRLVSGSGRRRPSHASSLRQLAASSRRDAGPGRMASSSGAGLRRGISSSSPGTHKDEDGIPQAVRQSIGPQHAALPVSSTPATPVALSVFSDATNTSYKALATAAALEPATSSQFRPMTTRQLLQGLVTCKHETDNVRQALTPGTLMFRGLRVRIGLHTGLSDSSCVMVNTHTGRLQYTGAALAMATSVCSAGTGGMVLLSDTTFMPVASACEELDVFVPSLGTHHLLDQEHPCQLYAAYSRPLVYRACVQPDLRHTRQLSPSFLDAPCGRVTICCMRVKDFATLKARLASLMRNALELCQAIVNAQLDEWGGYLAPCSEGLVVAAFLDPVAAIRWALSTLSACHDAPWDPDFLAHVLTGGQQDPGRVRSCPDTVQLGVPAPLEAASEGANFPDSLMVQQQPAQNGGLALQVAVDEGPVHAVVDGATGRMRYIGQPMTRAERVAQIAKAGEVWATAEAWDAARASPGNIALEVGVRTSRATGGRRVGTAAAAEQQDLGAGRQQLTGPGSPPSRTTPTAMRNRPHSALNQLGERQGLRSGSGGMAVNGIPIGSRDVRGLKDMVSLVSCRLKDAEVKTSLRSCNEGSDPGIRQGHKAELT